MKKNKGFLLFVLLLHFSCGMDSNLKINIDIPAASPVKLEQYKEILVTNFLVPKETNDFNLSQELDDYLSFELGKQFKGKMTSKAISLENEEVFKKQDLWKNLSSEQKQALFLTGKAQYTQETRKAILEKEKPIVDGPFKTEKKGLTERKIFTLELSLYLISAETGEALYQKDFKEMKSYESPKQTSQFVFYELIQRIKQKFFRTILGEGKSQERYLLTK
jgi:hypothetical protein